MTKLVNVDRDLVQIVNLAIHMDRTELKAALWCTRDEVVLQPTSHSLTNEMMTRFKKGLEC